MMMRKKFYLSVLFLVILAVATPVFAGWPADVQLMLDEQSVLPGTPTGLTLRVTNHGSSVLRLPATVWMTATNAAGKTFRLRAYSPSVGRNAATVESSVRDILPGESRELRFEPSQAIVGMTWLTDSALSSPGTYHLRAVFAPEVSTAGEFDRANAIVSNDVTLNVAVKSDDDRAVWEWMESTGGGQWGESEWIAKPGAFARIVMERYPRSNYALFAAVYYPLHDGPDKYAILEDVAKRFASSSFAEQVKLLLIHYHQSEQQTAYGRYNVAREHGDSSDKALGLLLKSGDESEKARILAMDLVEHSRSSITRQAAQHYLDTTPTREVLMREQASRN